ncbi:MAG: dihydrofolate reductase, partial [Chloroflexi bacterium]|nr:dihydrofolate reductase [Chloroflexota bacterium]
MRKVTSGLFISLDGVVEAPHLWQFDVFDADMEDAMIKMLADIDTIL